MYASAIGGYYLYISHLENLSNDILSLISHRIFLIRKALILNEKKADIDLGISIPLNRDVCYLGSFETQLDLKPIPLNFLDSFRILDFYSPDYKKIIHGYFVFMDFDVYNSKEFTDKFMLFITFLNPELFKCHYMINGGLSKKDYIEMMGDNEGNYNNFVKISCFTAGSVIRILEYCRNVYLEKKEMIKEEILWRAIAKYFKGSISSNCINIVGNLFSNIFNYRNLQYIFLFFRYFI